MKLRKVWEVRADGRRYLSHYEYSTPDGPITITRRYARGGDWYAVEFPGGVPKRQEADTLREAREIVEDLTADDTHEARAVAAEAAAVSLSMELGSAVALLRRCVAMHETRDIAATKSDASAFIAEFDRRRMLSALKGGGKDA